MLEVLNAFVYSVLCVVLFLWGHLCSKNIVVKHINKFDKIQNNKLSLWHKPKTIFFTLKELYLLKTKKRNFAEKFLFIFLWRKLLFIL